METIMLVFHLCLGGVVVRLGQSLAAKEWGLIAPSAICSA